MSHLTHVQNVFVRKDLLIESLREFVSEIQEPGRVRFYGRSSEACDIVAVLDRYDLGFRMQQLTPSQACLILDDTEDSSAMHGRSNKVYVPVCDFYTGEVEAAFGAGLSRLNEVYYRKLLEEEASLSNDGGHVGVVETEHEIIVTLEV